MDWDELRYTLAVARAGNLTGAAVALGVTRTTVGRRLAAAEARLGVRLFDRTLDGLVATAAGAELVAGAEAVEGEVSAAEGRLRGRDDELRGGLRVSTLDVLWVGFTDVFATFVARYPSVVLDVQISNAFASLRRREADVALRLSNDPGDGLHGRRVGEMHFAVYAARALVERVGADAPLQGYPWISNDERSPTPWLDAWLARHAPGARVAFRTDDYVVLRRAVSAGIGVHFVPCFEGDGDPGLVCLGNPLREEARGIWALTLPELRTNRRVRAFLDHCAEEFGRHRAALMGNAADPSCASLTTA